MPIEDNQLLGNWGEAYVAALLSKHCLVRSVAQGTDVGVDLYCESVVQSDPFLHFWVQVKTGEVYNPKQGEIASCPFEVRHLKYWSRQPVPVFAALVPGQWPVQEDRPVYVVDVTSSLIEDPHLLRMKKPTLYAIEVWNPREPESIPRFLRTVLPRTSALLLCRHGVINPLPTLTSRYVKQFPDVPVCKYKDAIFQQIRRTAAFSVLFLELAEEHADFRRMLANIVKQFEGIDRHWENSVARALSYHADGQFDNAVTLYEEAAKNIKEDPKFQQGTPLWELYVARISGLQQLAEHRWPPPYFGWMEGREEDRLPGTP